MENWGEACLLMCPSAHSKIDTVSCSFLTRSVGKLDRRMTIVAKKSDWSISSRSMPNTLPQYRMRQWGRLRPLVHFWFNLIEEKGWQDCDDRNSCNRCSLWGTLSQSS
jgi:hypothetical protein